MSYPNAIEVCRAELFTKEVELRERYPQALVDKVLRVREMYNWFIANPDGTDRVRYSLHRLREIPVPRQLRPLRVGCIINFLFLPSTLPVALSIHQMINFVLHR